MSLFHHKLKKSEWEQAAAAPSQDPGLPEIVEAAESVAAEPQQVEEAPKSRSRSRPRTTAVPKPRGKAKRVEGEDDELPPQLLGKLSTRPAAKAAARAMSQQIQLEAFDIECGIEAPVVPKEKPQRQPAKQRKPRKGGRKKRKPKKPAKPKEYKSVGARRMAELFKFAEKSCALYSDDEDTGRGKKKGK